MADEGLRAAQERLAETIKRVARDQPGEMREFAVRFFAGQGMTETMLARADAPPDEARRSGTIEHLAVAANAWDTARRLDPSLPAFDSLSEHQKRQWPSVLTWALNRIAADHGGSRRIRRISHERTEPASEHDLSRAESWVNDWPENWNAPALSGEAIDLAREAPEEPPS